MSALHRVAEVLTLDHQADGVRLAVRLPSAEAAPFLAYTV